MLRAIYWKPLSFNRMNKPKPPSPFFIYIIFCIAPFCLLLAFLLFFRFFPQFFSFFLYLFPYFFFFSIFFFRFGFILFIGSFFFLFHHLFHLSMKFRDYYDRRSMKRKWLIFQYSLQMNHSYYFGSYQYEITNNEYNVFEKKKNRIFYINDKWKKKILQTESTKRLLIFQIYKILAASFWSNG